MNDNYPMGYKETIALDEYVGSLARKNDELKALLGAVNFGLLDNDLFIQHMDYDEWRSRVREVLS